MKKLTKIQEVISRRNKTYAIKYFKDKGLYFEGCHMHHKDPSWFEYDIWRYIQWDPDDLVLLTSSEHIHVHGSNPLKYYIPEEDKGYSLEDMPWWVSVFYNNDY